MGWFFTALVATGILLVLQLIEVITVPWWVVFSPLIIYVAAIAVILTFIVIVSTLMVFLES